MVGINFCPHFDVVLEFEKLLTRRAALLQAVFLRFPLKNALLFTAARLGNPPVLHLLRRTSSDLVPIANSTLA